MCNTLIMRSIYLLTSIRSEVKEGLDEAYLLYSCVELLVDWQRGYGVRCAGTDYGKQAKRGLVGTMTSDLRMLHWDAKGGPSVSESGT